MMEVTEIMLKSSGLCLEVKGNRKDIVKEITSKSFVGETSYVSLPCRVPGTETCEIYSIARDEIGLIGSTYETMPSDEAKADAYVDALFSGKSVN